MKIHFVCTSNTFRSRLAATYLASKNIPDLIVTSSGIKAARNENGPVTWYAQRIIQEENLIKSEPMIWTQTTQEILDDQDWVIFMEQLHYDACVQKFGFTGKNFEIWNIKDIESDNESDLIKMPETEEIYKKITQKVDDLISRKFS